MKMVCEFAVRCAIPERDCPHKKVHEEMKIACGKIYCQRTRKRVRCTQVKGEKE